MVQRKVVPASVVPAKVEVPYVPFADFDEQALEELNADAAVIEGSAFNTLAYATGLGTKVPVLDENGEQAVDEITGEPLFNYDQKYKGFFVQVGNREIDEVMEARHIPTVTIVHGDGVVKTHWRLDEVAVYLLASGMPGSTKDDSLNGFIYTWGYYDQFAKEYKNAGFLSVQVLLRGLLYDERYPDMPVYEKPFTISARAWQSKDFHTALLAQKAVLLFAQETAAKSGRLMSLPLWAYSLILQATPTYITRGTSKKKDGSTEGGESSNIHVVRAKMPQELTTAYLARQEAPRAHHELLRSLTAEAKEWASERMKNLKYNPFKASENSAAQASALTQEAPAVGEFF